MPYGHQSSPSSVRSSSISLLSKGSIVRPIQTSDKYYVREVDRALSAHDLTHLQFTTLAMAAWLGRTGESVTQPEVARFADIHPRQVSQVLKTLERKGMVIRARGTSDVRIKHIGVTTPGIATLLKALPVVIDVQHRLFGDQGR